MNPKTEQEIVDLLASGQISQSQAQMYRAQLNNSGYNNIFGNIVTPPDWNSTRQPSSLSPNNMQFPANQNPNFFQGTDMSTLGNSNPPVQTDNGQVQGNTTNLFGDIFGGNSNMPTNPYGQEAQYTIFNGSPNTNTNPTINNPYSPSTQELSLTDKPTKEQWRRYHLEKGDISPSTADQQWEDYMQANQEGSPQNQNNKRGFPVIYPGGSDLSTELYTLGRSIGAPKGSTGRVAGIVGSSGAALFDISRNIASGIGYENMNKYVDQWYREQQFGGTNKNYVAAPQYQNNNYLGGFYGENGGMPQAQEQPQVQEQQMMQVASQVTKAIQQGQTPQAIVQALVQNGIPQVQAQQLVQQVMQHMQQATQQSPAEEQQEGQASNPQEESQETPMMKNGGTFKHKVGDNISFIHDGKNVKGVISKIENGKIYL